MTKTIHFLLASCCLFLFFTSCQKETIGSGEPGKSGSVPVCSYATTSNIATLGKKWSNTIIHIDSVNNAGKTEKTIFDYPIGFLQLNKDSSYNVFSNNVPFSGKWTINKKCQLVLDSAKNIQRNFDVVAVSSDSLIIRRKKGNLTYTQYYRLFNCVDESKLVFTWNNTYIKTDYMLNNVSNKIADSYTQYPVGFFKLNTNSTYNVVSNGVPLNGTWLLNGNNCQLVLDPKTTIERSFDIVQVSSDSLTIRRRDTSYRLRPVIYTQHYLKNK